MNAICAIDVETDGLHPACRAWEVALIRRGDDGQSEHRWLLPIELGPWTDKRALDLGGYWERHPHGRALTGRSPLPAPVTDGDQAARQIMRLTHGATLIGSAPWFDADVLARLFRAHGCIPTWSHRLRDVSTLVAGRTGTDPGGLDDALAACELTMPERDRHTALGDARAALAVYDVVMAPQVEHPGGTP